MKKIMQNMKFKKISCALLVVIFAVSFVFYATNVGEANVAKEYRAGVITKIGPKDYVVASNKQFVEILEITSDDKLVQVGEVHGMDVVNDLCVGHEGDQTYVFVLTGQYINKYNISNPQKPVVERQRDLYEWRNSMRKIGYMKNIACDETYVYTSGDRGMRSFYKDTLVPNDNFMILEKTFGMESNGYRLVAMTEKGASLYSPPIQALKITYEFDNVSGSMRQPAVDDSENMFVPADNSLVRVAAFTLATSTYFNPVEPGVTYSYAVAVAPDQNVYYVNGYGLTKLTNNLNKLGFFFSASNYEYGPNSWAIDVAVGQTNKGERVVIFNKSSIILVDRDLKFLDHYMYSPLAEYSQGVETELSIKLSNSALPVGTPLTVWFYGFWPNEEVKVSLEKSEAAIEADNLGFGVASLTVPNVKPGINVVKAHGQESGLEYQMTFEIK